MLVETAEASEFDNTWNKMVGTGGSIDGDYAASSVSGSTPGWQNECIRIRRTTSDLAYNYAEFDSHQYFDTHNGSFELIIFSHTMAAGQNVNIFSVNASHNSEDGAVRFSLHNDAGSLVLRIHVKVNGGYAENYSNITLSLDTNYKITWTYNTETLEYDWFIDGVRQRNNIDFTTPITLKGVLTTPATENRFVVIGTVATTTKVFEYFIDNIFVGALEGGIGTTTTTTTTTTTSTVPGATTHSTTSSSSTTSSTASTISTHSTTTTTTTIPPEGITGTVVTPSKGIPRISTSLGYVYYFDRESIEDTTKVSTATGYVFYFDREEI